MEAYRQRVNEFNERMDKQSAAKKSALLDAKKNRGGKCALCLTVTDDGNFEHLNGDITFICIVCLKKLMDRGCSGYPIDFQRP